ncbi:HslU--HslV peptidase ATPase subunit [Aquibacillus koreensis]|uniref:ATP-dependent protease ATPase subunit HslU n=1 Tax=Aquibacillus koreensis TaxID=279446 RepID=A0A9X3WLC1_9BACI|nr:HslU--HslV peptidase ATPase subunit [Aquibacillus koreensis]MCT2534514.1 HslU--HslV peptidase ATPase subunit [Aquibacillus koreensis]MDC3421892.1 HslU--HslV peptidase ATPase subunit [Aquibacillus koreensis]
MSINMTPKQIVAQLDKYIIGQVNAKKSVAIALRNRYRRLKLEENMREEIVPKNILMIGPTGVGKTEVARRLAKLVGAPFVKVEATKFTEVGYVGRDVESMIRDLVEMAMRLVKEEKMSGVMERASDLANKRLVEIIVPKEKKQNSFKNPLEMFFSPQQDEDDQTQEQDPDKQEIETKRKRVGHQLALGELEDKIVTIEVDEQSSSMFDMLQGSGMEQMGMNMQDAFGQLMPKKKKKRKLPVSEARKILTQQEAQKLIDMDEVTQEAVEKVEQSGIVFIDEIDKVAGKSEQSANVSREGVQRDILPIVEGSTVVTKHGPVKTDHILFIAAGAFHMAKPSDLIPELQGRFPIRVEFEKLSIDDFKKILVEPSNALLKQYTALLETEGVKVTFTEDAVTKLAEVAYQVNQETDNIGARRLHTILEKLLEDLSFEASDIAMGSIEITENYVDEKLSSIAKNKDLSQYIL